MGSVGVELSRWTHLPRFASADHQTFKTGRLFLPPSSSLPAFCCSTFHRTCSAFFFFCSKLWGCKQRRSPSAANKACSNTSRLHEGDSLLDSVVWGQGGAWPPVERVAQMKSCKPESARTTSSPPRDPFITPGIMTLNSTDPT